MKAKKSITVEISMEEVEATSLVRALHQAGIDHPILDHLNDAGVTGETMEERIQTGDLAAAAQQEKRKEWARRYYLKNRERLKAYGRRYSEKKRRAKSKSK